MATASFSKRFVIDEAAADVMISLLDKPIPPRPDLSGRFRELTEEDLQCHLQQYRLAKLSAQAKNET